MQTTRKIANIYARRDAMHEACTRWDIGNSAGEGYSWDMPRSAVIVLCKSVEGEVDVFRLADGSEVAVASRWAVTITPAHGGAR